MSEPDNIIQFPKVREIRIPGKCRKCRGLGVEGATIGRMYSEITCRRCKGEGKEPRP